MDDNNEKGCEGKETCLCDIKTNGCNPCMKNNNTFYNECDSTRGEYIIYADLNRICNE